MIDAPGVGLAAPQIGVGLRVFTYDVDDQSATWSTRCCTSRSDEEQDGDEGCLSIPGLSFDCRRRQTSSRTGRTCTATRSPIEGTATCSPAAIQHETDHLDGMLFVDRLDAETKKAALAAIREAEWSDEPAPVVKASPHPLFGPAR